MINIKIPFAMGNSSISVAGHADPSVCAGVSAIMQTLAGWLLNCDGIADDIQINLSKGYSFVSFHSDDERAKEVFKAARIGLYQIEKGYPLQVHIEEL